ncbi:putative ferric reductase transmembrane component-like domain-containing protein [Septoria linicola]|nr:putative ferric reductase transmembrane component-like domain-containing protein [Septoria linicola]
MSSRSKQVLLLLLSCVWTLSVSASQASQRPRGSGFIGYGISMYKPACATACRDSVKNPLNCNGTSDHSHMMKRMGGMSMEKPSPECYANNDRFLQSVAFCVSQHCQDVPTWQLEQWWAERIPGRTPGQPAPKESYQEALANVDTPPNATISSDEMLMDENTLVDGDTYLANFNGDDVFEMNESTHARYGLILLTTGAAIPIALSLLRFIPFPRAFASRFNAIFVDPPVFGTKHSVPWLNTFITPTRGQAFFIAYLWIINITLCSIGYQTRRPNSWFETTTQEIATYISYRTGILSFVNVALLVLYAGRNNVLLWVTDWSHSTFLLLHRWIAFICTLQACVHSAILLQIYVNQPDYDYISESKSPYWVWGIVATLGLVILLPTSILPIRRKVYELFLAWHVVLAFFVLIGGYYHVVLCFGHQWGYETWLLIAFACWTFDRVMRILRITRNGIRTARVTIIDEDYIRLDISGVAASGHAYLYFPTLTWRVWENHPFSIVGALSAHQEPDHHMSEQSSQSSIRDPTEKLPSQTIAPIASPPPQQDLPHTHHPGLTFFIRTHTGTTSLLRARKSLPILIESSYGHNIFSGIGSSNSSKSTPLSTYPNLICIAGGVGITALLPHLTSHNPFNSNTSKRLYWGVRSLALVSALHNTLSSYAHANVEVEIVQNGGRLDLIGIVEKAVREDGGVGTAIVVSGPGSMADEVRVLVSRCVKKEGRQGNGGVVVRFVEESFTW